MLPDRRPSWADLSDPRRETRNTVHPLSDILRLGFGAVLSGVADGVGLEAVAEHKEAGLRNLLELPTGIASHDTLSDGFGRQKPGAFAEAVLRWAPVAVPSLAGEPVRLEGKTPRGSRGGAHSVHRPRADAAKARVVVARQAVGDKTTEMTAIPVLLSRLEVEGAWVSMEARGCQKAIARDLLDGGADQAVALKDNHPHLREDVRLWRDTEAARGRPLPRESVEQDHGRRERRRYVGSDASDGLPQQPAWAGLQTVGGVESTRRVGAKTTTDDRYYASMSVISLGADPRGRPATPPRAATSGRPDNLFHIARLP